MGQTCNWNGDGPECGQPARYEAVNMPDCPDYPFYYCLEHADWLRRMLEAGEQLWCLCDEEQHLTPGLRSIRAAA